MEINHTNLKVSLISSKIDNKIVTPWFAVNIKFNKDRKAGTNSYVICEILWVYNFIHNHCSLQDNPSQIHLTDDRIMNHYTNGNFKHIFLCPLM